MNQMTLLVVILVAYCYFGGKYCPSVLKQNKEILLGVAGGLFLSAFFGIKLEGIHENGRSHYLPALGVTEQFRYANPSNSHPGHIGQGLSLRYERPPSSGGG